MHNFTPWAHSFTWIISSGGSVGGTLHPQGSSTFLKASLAPPQQDGPWGESYIPSWLLLLPHPWGSPPAAQPGAKPNAVSKIFLFLWLPLQSMEMVWAMYGKALGL